MPLIKRSDYKKATGEFLDHWKQALAHLGEMEDIITLMWYYEHDILKEDDDIAQLVITASDLFDEALLLLHDAARHVEQVNKAF